MSPWPPVWRRAVAAAVPLEAPEHVSASKEASAAGTQSRDSPVWGSLWDRLSLLGVRVQRPGDSWGGVLSWANSATAPETCTCGRYVCVLYLPEL